MDLLARELNIIKKNCLTHGGKYQKQGASKVKVLDGGQHVLMGRKKNPPYAD